MTVPAVEYLQTRRSCVRSGDGHSRRRCSHETPLKAHLNGFAERLGGVTASRIADVVSRVKTGYGASRTNYMAELITERLTGQTAPALQERDAMRWGSEQEDRPVKSMPASTMSRSNRSVSFHIALIADCGCSPDSPYRPIMA